MSGDNFLVDISNTYLKKTSQNAAKLLKGKYFSKVKIQFISKESCKATP